MEIPFIISPIMAMQLQTSAFRLESTTSHLQLPAKLKQTPPVLVAFFMVSHPPRAAAQREGGLTGPYQRERSCANSFPNLRVS